jgi:heme a synthase
MIKQSNQLNCFNILVKITIPLVLLPITMSSISRFFQQFAVIVFATVFLVILAGGVVRTTQSGMGCPDWPKCFGMWIPPTSADQLPPDFEKYLRKQDIDHTFNAYHTWVEYINRLLGVLLGLLALIQAVWAFKHKKRYPRVFKWAGLFLLLVILTGLFGAIVVKLNLSHLSISVHLLFAVLLAQVQLLLLKAMYLRIPAAIDTRGRNLLWIFLIAVVVQSVLGTVVRMHVDDVSKALNYAQREKWLSDLPLVLLIHRTFSWAVLLLLCYLVYYLRGSVLKNKLFLLAALVVGNILVGIALFYADMPYLAQPIHLLLATGIITQCCYLLVSSKAIKN